MAQFLVTLSYSVVSNPQIKVSLADVLDIVEQGITLMFRIKDWAFAIFFLLLF